jgi:hypothetical protein
MITTSSKQEFVKRIFKHNLREKLLAALCTLVLMLVAVCLRPVNRVYSVKVSTNISSDQILVSGNAGLVEVKVSGNFFELRKIKSEDLVMNFDFSSEKAGEISLNIGEKELPAVFLPLDVKSVSPQTLVFITEEKKEETAPEAAASSEEAVNESADQEHGANETAAPAKEENGGNEEKNE